MSETVNKTYPQRTIWQPLEIKGGGIGIGGNGEQLGLNMRVTPRRIETPRRRMLEKGNYSRQARREQALFDIAQNAGIAENRFKQTAGLTREDVRGIVMDTVIEAMR